MQAIATEFNYSESTFVLPPRDPLHTARVRIFTPTNEIPFAGHPNVGTAYAIALLAQRGGATTETTLVFEEEAGLVPVEIMRDAEGYVLGATLTAPQPLALGDKVPAALVAECIGLPPAAIVTARHEPIIASVGLPFTIAEVTTEALGRAKPNAGAFARAARRFPSKVDRFSLHVYARACGDDERADLRARMFAPLSGILEDPATGSANAALGALLASITPEPNRVVELKILQGVEMGRPSLLAVTTEKRGGTVTCVRVGGHCVPAMEGTFVVAS